MVEEECINSELRGILEEFTRIRNAYVALKAYCEIREEAASMEKEQVGKMRENLEKLSATYLLLEKRYKSTVEKLQTEMNELRKVNEELKEQCDHLRLVNVDRGGNADQMCKLQDEMEALKAQLLMQEEKHTEDVALLKKQHSDELQRYKVLLQNAKLASTSCETKKGARAKNLGNNKRKVSFFRWPELSVERVNGTSLENEEETVDKNCGKKKRKLFYEDKDTLIDIS
ncbi:uncharacterized protein LOC122531660 isoform X1 [Frieseomelitta varia]|uniref:uncharacterized protein LOC122531660 isoform X1 n=2 Tax=Frieseomelitta varia TaxID=561572 RepID=UPI001CB6AB54|nr:uncharacterized protein LOC122531660 isoform X1 [Frieseomelitta varia]